MTPGITENGIDCSQTTRDIIHEHLDLVSISLSRLEREFESEDLEIPEELKAYISDVDEKLNELQKEHYNRPL